MSSLVISLDLRSNRQALGCLVFLFQNTTDKSTIKKNCLLTELFDQSEKYDRKVWIKNICKCNAPNIQVLSF